MSVGAPWGWIAYGAVALVLPAHGQSRPGWDNLVGVGRVGLLTAGVFLFFGSSDLAFNEWFEAPPGQWIPLLGLVLVSTATYLAPPFEKPETDARSTVLAAVPLAVFAAAVAIGLMLAPDFRWDRIVPLGCVIAALALGAGALRGQWRPLMAPAVLAMAFAALTVAADVRLRGAVGDLTVDLARLTTGGRPVTYRATVGIGELRMVVPNRIRVAIDARVGRGSLLISGYTSGFGRSVNEANFWVGPRPRRDGALPPVALRVIADVGLGQIEIVRAHQRGSRF